MFFILSENGLDQSDTGLTICLGGAHAKSTWTWKGPTSSSNGVYVCDVIDLFEEIEKKILDK